MGRKKLEETELKSHKDAVWKALTSNPEVQCPKCKYGWIPRKEKPKACPRCKTRLDWK